MQCCAIKCTAQPSQNQSPVMSELSVGCTCKNHPDFKQNGACVALMMPKSTEHGLLGSIQHGPGQSDKWSREVLTACESRQVGALQMA